MFCDSLSFNDAVHLVSLAVMKSTGRYTGDGRLVLGAGVHTEHIAVH